MHTSQLLNSPSRQSPVAGPRRGAPCRTHAAPRATPGPAFAAVVFILFVAGFSGLAEPMLTVTADALSALSNPAGWAAR